MDTMSTEHQHTIGELLKQARLRHRLAVAECAKRTHIATRFIEALEEERWDVLPSESHRLGFLRLYSRFLGVSSDEALTLYRQQQQASQSTPSAKAGTDVPGAVERRGSDRREKDVPARPRAAARRTWSPSSVPQLITFGIVALVLAWVLYHLLSPRLFEPSAMPWTKRRVLSEARLSVPSRASVQIHKVRIKAEANGWLRVSTDEELLYEGILRTGSIKEWSGGPFYLKIGDVSALSLLWNDQPYDITQGARGQTNTFRIPPP